MLSQWDFETFWRKTKTHFLIIMRLSGTSKPDDEGNQSFLYQPQRKWLQQMFLVTIEDPQRKSEVSEVGGSESGARMAVRSDDIEKKQKMLSKMMSLSQE